MEFLEFKNEELSKKFREWWLMSRLGNLPINHPADLGRFAELVKLSVGKQDELNSDALYNFLHEQLDKGNLKKGQEEEINIAVAMFDFGVNYLVK